jgi:drug/metabolite transporter (DMT)-like permease
VALRQISAFSAMLAINLEPVYAVVLAAILFGEQRQLDAMFYLGMAVLIGAIVAHAWQQRAGSSPDVSR